MVSCPAPWHGAGWQCMYFAGLLWRPTLPVVCPSLACFGRTVRAMQRNQVVPHSHLPGPFARGTAQWLAPQPRRARGGTHNSTCILSVAPNCPPARPLPPAADRDSLLEGLRPRDLQPRRGHPRSRRGGRLHARPQVGRRLHAWPPGALRVPPPRQVCGATRHSAGSKGRSHFLEAALDVRRAASAAAARCTAAPAGAGLYPGVSTFVMYFDVCFLPLGALHVPPPLLCLPAWLHRPSNQQHPTIFQPVTRGACGSKPCDAIQCWWQGDPAAIESSESTPVCLSSKSRSTARKCTCLSCPNTTAVYPILSPPAMHCRAD